MHTEAAFYSASIPAAFTTAGQVAKSVLIVWDKRSGEPPTAFTPMAANFSTTCGDRNISFTSPL